VARLLWESCPGTHTAYCGGTIHIAFSTSQVRRRAGRGSAAPYGGMRRNILLASTT
jgi:hypothetical protein